MNIVKSNLGNLQESLLNVNNKFTEIDNNFEILKTKIGDLERTNIEEKLKNDITTHLIQVDELINEYELELESLIDAILFAKKGLIHPKIVNPKQLLTSLTKLQSSHKEHEFPISLSLSSLTNIVDISKIEVAYVNLKIIYIISIPMTYSEKYILYNLIPVPVRQRYDDNPNRYAFIQPSNQYIGLNSNKQTYLPLREKDFRECIKIQKLYICKQKQPIFNVNARKTCETDLLIEGFTSDLLTNCDVRILELKSAIWNQLTSENQWLYFLIKPEMLHILCPNQETISVQLEQSGIISLRPKCSGFSQTVILSTKLIITAQETKMFVPSVNLDIVELSKAMQKGKFVNLSEIPLINLHKNPHLNIHDLQGAGVKLSEITRQAEEIQTHHRNYRYFNSVENTIYYLGYIIVGLVILYISIKCSCLRKIVLILRYLFTPKEGCTNYFVNCFNSRDSHDNQTRGDLQVTYRSNPVQEIAVPSSPPTYQASVPSAPMLIGRKNVQSHFTPHN